MAITNKTSKPKVITGVRLRTERAEMLREKAIELTIQQKEIVKETDLVNFLIDEFVERIKIDKNGLYIEEESQK